MFKDGSRNFAIFKMKVFATISNVGLTTYGQYLHVAAVTRSSLSAKLKSDTNGHVLKAASDSLSCFVDMLLQFFFENTDYFLFHEHSVSLQKLITKMETGIIADFIFWGFINRSNHQHMFWRMFF